MASTRFSTKGQVVIPKDIRDLAQVKPGAEYDVRTDGTVITLIPKLAYRHRLKPSTTEDLLALQRDWHGPPITDEMIRDAAAEAAIERFERSLK